MCPHTKSFFSVVGEITSVERLCIARVDQVDGNNNHSPKFSFGMKPLHPLPFTRSRCTHCQKLKARAPIAIYSILPFTLNTQLATQFREPESAEMFATETRISCRSEMHVVGSGCEFAWSSAIPNMRKGGGGHALFFARRGLGGGGRAGPEGRGGSVQRPDGLPVGHMKWGRQ